MIKRLFEKYKIYIYICVPIIIVIALLIIILINRKPSIYKYMKVENIKKVDTIKINDYSFLDKYNIEGEVNKLEKDIVVGNYIGSIYYIRNNNNYNIYQIKIDTSNNDKNIPILVQIKETINDIDKSIINSFKNIVFIEDKLEGKSNYKFNLSIEESIFKDNRNYVKIYKDKDIEYHINYYMNNGYLVCELVKKL